MAVAKPAAAKYAMLGVVALLTQAAVAAVPAELVLQLVLVVFQVPSKVTPHPLAAPLRSQ